MQKHQYEETPAYCTNTDVVSTVTDARCLTYYTHCPVGDARCPDDNVHCPGAEQAMQRSEMLM